MVHAETPANLTYYTPKAIADTPPPAIQNDPSPVSSQNLHTLLHANSSFEKTGGSASNEDGMMGLLVLEDSTNSIQETNPAQRCQTRDINAESYTVSSGELGIIDTAHPTSPRHSPKSGFSLAFQPPDPYIDEETYDGVPANFEVVIPGNDEVRISIDSRQEPGSIMAQLDLRKDSPSIPIQSDNLEFDNRCIRTPSSESPVLIETSHTKQSQEANEKSLPEKSSLNLVRNEARAEADLNVYVVSDAVTDDSASSSEVEGFDNPYETAASLLESSQKTDETLQLARSYKEQGLFHIAEFTYIRVLRNALEEINLLGQDIPKILNEIISYMKLERPPEVMLGSIENCYALMSLLIDHETLALNPALALRMAGVLTDLLSRYGAGTGALTRLNLFYRKSIDNCYQVVWRDRRWRFQISLGETLSRQNCPGEAVYTYLRALGGCLSSRARPLTHKAVIELITHLHKACDVLKHEANWRPLCATIANLHGMITTPEGTASNLRATLLMRTMKVATACSIVGWYEIGEEIYLCFERYGIDGTGNRRAIIQTLIDRSVFHYQAQRRWNEAVSDLVRAYEVIYKLFVWQVKSGHDTDTELLALLRESWAKIPRKFQKVTQESRINEKSVHEIEEDLGHLLGSQMSFSMIRELHRGEIKLAGSGNQARSIMSSSKTSGYGSRYGVTYTESVVTGLSMNYSSIFS